MSETPGGLPAHTSIIIPRLFCHDPEAEIAFCVGVFDATELNRRPGPDGSVGHALLEIGPDMIMIEAIWPSLPSRAPHLDGSSPVVATRIEETTAEERTDRWSDMLAAGSHE